MASAVSVEFSDRFEEIEKVCAIILIERRHKAGVDKDKLRPEALFVDSRELRGPGVWVVSMWAQLRKDLFGDVGGLARVGGWFVSPQSEGDLFGFVEAHHDIPRV